MASDASKKRPCGLLRTARGGLIDHGSDGTNEVPSTPGARLKVCCRGGLRLVEPGGTVEAGFCAKEGKTITRITDILLLRAESA